MFCALLDTSVLWPSLQRDFLLSLAAVDLYRPLWSEQILEELEHAEHAKLLARGATEDQARARVARLLAEMRRAFADAIVSGHDPLIGTYGLPDPDDEHVVAAAVVNNHPEVALCLRCAHFVHQRAWEVEDQGRISHGARARDAWRRLRRTGFERGWHQRRWIGRPIRAIARHLP